MSSSVDQSIPGAPPSATAPPSGYVVRLPVPRFQPVWTYVLLGVIGLVWLAMTVAGGSENLGVLVFFGAKVNSLIVAGQYWRLLTSTFLHIGILHLAFNGYALYAFGLQIEMRYGHWRFVLLYLLSGIAGSMLSFLGNDALSAGASGSIFGLVGAGITYFASYRQEFGAWGRRQLTNMVGIAALNLVLGLANPMIDNLGHIGGFLAGLALGWAYLPVYETEPDASQPSLFRLTARFRNGRAALVTTGLVVLLVVLLAWGVRWRA